MNFRYYPIWVCAVALMLGGLACQKKSTSPPPVAPPLRLTSTDAIYNPREWNKEHSIIFFFTDWCGYCTKMKKITLADSTVIAILNESFNCAIVNPDIDSQVVYFDSSITCRQLANRYSVTGYPTAVFLCANGVFIAPLVGYRQPIDFISILERIRSGDYDAVCEE